MAAVNNGTAGGYPDGRQLRRLSPGPHRAGRVPAQATAAESRLCTVVPRRGRPGRHDRRRERHPVHARHERPTARGTPSAPSAAAASSPPGSGPARPYRVAYHERDHRSPERQGSRSHRGLAGRHLRAPAQHGRRDRGGRRRRLGQRARQRHRVRRPRGRRRVHAPATTRTGTAQYRILNPIPDPAATGTDVFVPAAAAARRHRRGAPAPPATTATTPSSRPTAAPARSSRARSATLALPATAGDYFRRKVPWNGTTGTSNDAPNGQSATFTTQISAWCLTCHTRYLSAGWDVKTTGRDLQVPPHVHRTSRNCITCHVAHGSNAQMTGSDSANMEYPGGAAAPVGDSRLLKVDNRGTCQLCHDPDGDDRRRAAGRPHAGPGPSLATPSVWWPARRLPATRRPSTWPKPRRRAANDRLASPPRNSRLAIAAGPNGSTAPRVNVQHLAMTRTKPA